MVERPLSSNECLAVGAVFVTVAVFYLYMLCFRPVDLRRMHRLRHTDGGEKGPPVSRVSGFALVLMFGAFGFVIVADGYCHAINRMTGMYVLLAFFCLNIVTAIFDSIRTRMRRGKGSKETLS